MSADTCAGSFCADCGNISRTVVSSATVLMDAVVLQVLDFLQHAESNHTNPSVSRFFKLHCIKVHSTVGAALIAGLAVPQLIAVL